MSYVYRHEVLDYEVRTPHQHAEAGLSELAIFDAPPITREIDGVYREKIHCREAGLDHTVDLVQFEIKPTNECISLSDSYISCTVKLQKLNDDGTMVNPAATDTVGIANNVLYTLFRDQLIHINDRQIHATHQTYFLQCYLQLLTSLSEESFEKWKIAGYYNDQLVR